MVFDFDIYFHPYIKRKSITRECILELLNDTNTKRIHFATSHAEALKCKNDRYELKLKMIDSFNPIAKKELGLDPFMFQSRYGDGFYRIISADDELEKIKTFINKYSDIVFLRDCLDLSISLSMHMINGVHTEVGLHEYNLKYNPGTQEAAYGYTFLRDLLQLRLEQLPFFKLVDYIAAVPSSKPFVKDLIQGLNGFDFEDISTKVVWANKSSAAKDVMTHEERISAFDEWQLKIDSQVDMNGKSVLLVDDMYKSGATLQYVAMKLKEAGAKYVFGLTLVKAQGNR